MINLFLQQPQVGHGVGIEWIGYLALVLVRPLWQSTFAPDESPTPL